MIDTRLVRSRLWGLSPAAVALARAVAALGDCPPVGVAYALAGIHDRVGTRAHASLAAAGLLEPDELSFTHPLIREATLADLIPAARSCVHRRAARLLAEVGASDAQVAVHVLATDLGTAPGAATLLQRTGERALAAGDARLALHHLRRALRESGADPAPELLLALGLAEAQMGDPVALTWLSRAAATGCPSVAARAEQARARVRPLRAAA